MILQLFDITPEKPSNTCKTCAFRERWQVGGTVIQYCSKRKNPRQWNGLLKIKCKDQACTLYQSIIKSK